MRSELNGPLLFLERGLTIVVFLYSPLDIFEREKRPKWMRAQLASRKRQGGSSILGQGKIEVKVLALFGDKIIDPWIEFIVFRCVPGGVGYRSSHILRVTNLTPDPKIGSNNTWCVIILAWPKLHPHSISESRSP